LQHQVHFGSESNFAQIKNSLANINLQSLSGGNTNKNNTSTVTVQPADESPTLLRDCGSRARGIHSSDMVDKG